MAQQLIHAAINGDLVLVEYLVESGIDIHSGHDAALIGASEYGHISVVKYLIAHGADIHTEDDDALWYAARAGHFEIVKCLIANGANVYAKSNDVLSVALAHRHSKMIKYLFDVHINSRFFIEYTITVAILMKNFKYVKLHIKYSFKLKSAEFIRRISINISKLIIRNLSLSIRFIDRLARIPAVYKYYKPTNGTNTMRKLYRRYMPKFTAY